jgi:PBSX family phage terminase large subunit
MQFHPAQSQIVKDNHRFRVIDSGRRFGKTTLVAYEMVGIAASQPDARVPYYAPTRDDARDIMWGMLQKAAADLIVDKNEGRLELTIRNKFGGTSLLPLYGWEAVQERKKGVGVKNNHIFLDEVAKYRNFWEGWQEVLRPTLTDLRGGATFISTPNGFNHFYDLYGKENEDPDFKSFHFTTYDNPFIPVEEIEKAKSELTEDRFAQEYLADFRKTQGLVYKEFDRVKHLYDTYEGRTVETIAGVDFGFTNPCAVLSIKRDADEGLWVEDEWYKTGQTDSQIAEYVSAQHFNKVYPDPESPSAIEELKKRKVNIREVVKNKDSVKNGITKVRELFKSGKLHINKRCVNLIYELETYAYPEKKDAHNPDENPIKENDHACDALRYPILMLSEFRAQAQQYRPQNLDRSTIPTIQPKFAKQFIPNQLRPR